MSNNSKEIRRLAGIYNMIPNLFWSILLLVPISVFCYTQMTSNLFWTFLAISGLAVFLPKSFFDSTQLSQNSVMYKKLGVGFFNRFIQNGDIVNNLIKKRYPGYKVVSKNNASYQQLISQTYLFEKFHFILFLFFLLATIYAIGKEYLVWALVFFITNLLYNIYPSFLQQYIRLRLRRTMPKDNNGQVTGPSPR